METAYFALIKENKKGSTHILLLHSHLNLSIYIFEI